MKLVETPPGPPVIASVVAEVYGQPDHRYDDLLLAADTVRARLAIEPGVVDVDQVREAVQQKIIFVTDKEKAALNGITTEQIAGTLQAVLEGSTVGVLRSEHRTQSAADRVASPDGSTDERGRPGESSCHRKQWPTCPAGRVGAMGHCPRGPDDLPQKPPARGLRIRGDRRPTAGRRGGGRVGRQTALPSPFGRGAGGEGNTGCYIRLRQQFLSRPPSP